MVANHCAVRRPEWESYHEDVEWNRVVAEIEAVAEMQDFSRAALTVS